MESGFYADSGRLALHQDYLDREQQTALRLRELLYRARRLAAPEKAILYDCLVSETERLCTYFRDMANQVGAIGDEVAYLSQQIAVLLTDIRL